MRLKTIERTMMDTENSRRETCQVKASQAHARLGDHILQIFEKEELRRRLVLPHIGQAIVVTTGNAISDTSGNWCDSSAIARGM